MLPNIHPVGDLTVAQVQSVLLSSAAAPPLHRMRPWWFERTATTLQLHADLGRRLLGDGDHRRTLLACGAALLNMRVAIRSLGVAADFRLLPEPSSPTLVAIVRPEGAIVATTGDHRLADATFDIHTDRGPFLDRPVEKEARDKLWQAARSEQVWFAGVPRSKNRELQRLSSANRSASVPELVTEWGNASDTGLDGIGSSGFALSTLIGVIGSFDDLPLAQLQAGQAMQRVLLTATIEGLSWSFLWKVIEIPEARRSLREMIGGGLWPQALLRLGYAATVPIASRQGNAGWVGVTGGG